MTYASIILPYEYKKEEVKADSKTKQTLKGRLTSAMQKGGAALKNAIQNPSKTFDDLGKYMQTAEATVSKFSGIALAQMLVSGKVTNQAALDYLFLGFAPALDQQAIAMGYSGATQMKDAIANGTINVGSFVSGFSKTLKGITDYRIAQKNKEKQQDYHIIELDATFNDNEQFQSESPDRRTETRNSYQDVLHNLPYLRSLECGLQDGRRYSVTDFKTYLTQLRDSKSVFKMTIGNEPMIENLVLQNFSPTVVGARSGLDYTLEVKKVNIGSVELTPITIEPLDVSLYTEKDKNGGEGVGTGIGNVGGNVNVPNTIANDLSDGIEKFLSKPQNRSIAKHIYRMLKE